MAGPSRRVLSLPPTIRFREVENFLDALPKATRGFRLCLPNRLQRGGHMAGIDGGNRKLAEYRRRVIAQRIGPLLAVGRVAPAGRLRVNIKRGDLIEGLA